MSSRGRTVERPCRVLIVDDSPTMRRLIRTGIDSDHRLQVVGEAGSALEARELVKQLSPDIMTLDVEMPGMNGLEFLARLMRARPMPVVMLSSLTAQGSEAAIRALSLGALDCVEKPRFGAARETFARLAELLFVLSAVRPGHRASVPRVNARAQERSYEWNGKAVLIGSSTGGVDALERMFSEFPADGPPTFVTQHMPAQFLASFAVRLNQTVRPSVRVATHGDIAKQGEILIAPGGAFHLHIDPTQLTKVQLVNTPKRSGHRPSVDEMFMRHVRMAPGSLRLC